MILGIPTRLVMIDWQPARLTDAERLYKFLIDDRVDPVNSGVKIMDKGSVISVHRLIKGSISGMKRINLSESRHLDEAACQDLAG
jgi:hypothetical protein